MDKAKPGEIQELCSPNAILTFKEYLEDYAGEETKQIGEKQIQQYLAEISNPTLRRETEVRLREIVQGKRDLYF